MSFKKYFYFYLISLHFWGCATPYQELKKNGGYIDTKINDRVYSVSFKGNNYTSDQKIHNYFLKRSAEIGLKHRYPFFVVIETVNINQFTNVTSEGTSSSKKKITTNSYSSSLVYSPSIQKTIQNHTIEGKIAFYKQGEQPLNALKVEDILNK